jgi:hypothetical protein
MEIELTLKEDGKHLLNGKEFDIKEVESVVRSHYFTFDTLHEVLEKTPAL